MNRINNDCFLIESTNNGAVVQLIGGADRTFGAGDFAAQDSDFIPWGANNRKPNQMLRLKEQNNQIKPLFEAARDMIYGSSLGFFKRRIQDKTKLQWEK